MYKRSHLGLAVAVALALPAAHAEMEVTTVIKNETSLYLFGGQSHNQATSMLDDSTDHDSGQLMKFENSARFFINGDLGENATWHGDLNFIYDTEGVDGYKGYKRFSQNDWLRELYVDTSAGDWDIRAGKAQEVWGTADGIKLLDIINPTDFRELNQNTMEDSRIPVWMIKGERNIGETGNIQLLMSQAEPNKIPGLNPSGDPGQPFILKGVDTITGQVNGFYNIAPALANVAGTFSAGALQGGFAATGAPPSAGLVPFTGLTVEGFARNSVDTLSVPGQFLFPGQPGYNAANAQPGYVVLNGLAQYGFGGGDPNGNYNITNLMNVTGPNPDDTSWNSGEPTSAFEYMANATFATFNSFSSCNDGDGGGCDNLYNPYYNPTGTDSLTGGVTTQYRRDYPDDRVNFGGRYRGSLENGLNFSLNYFWHYSANPDINLSWHDAKSGEELQVLRAPQTMSGLPDTDPAHSLSAAAVPTAVTTDVYGNATNSTTILLRNKAGQFYGPIDPATGSFNTNPNSAVLRFNETLHRVHSIGGSFDYAMDVSDFPVVLRGEFLYDHNDRQPVVDKKLLAIGDLTNSLKMEEADYFKYVLGVDVTVLTNMLASFQFIQFINLDFVDQNRNCTTQFGVTYNCSRYTADFPTLHLSNGLRQGYEYKEFYSFFLSKPFGESQLGRWNNIIIYEEGGGFWDRLDAEYSFTDQFIMTGEINMYWGNDNTTFGQFEKSSNVQVGFKYILE